MERKIDVGVLGATGMVGQQFVVAARQPPVVPAHLGGASERSAGQRYGDAAPWRLPTPPPRDDRRPASSRHAAPGQRARAAVLGDGCLGRRRDRAGLRQGRPLRRQQRPQPPHVADVPLLVPEVNSDHLALIDAQRTAARLDRRASSPTRTARRSSSRWRSRRCASSACRSVAVTTLQALSGAGYPGVASLDAVGNVVPFIDGEEAEDRERAEEDPRRARRRTPSCRIPSC